MSEKGHGVLSFNSDQPYAIPVSYGYDVENERCFLQLFFGEDSKKRKHLDKDDGVCLVVYEWRDITDWQSVVITGRLTEISDAEAPKSARAFAQGASLPDMSVFSDSLIELEIEWYELVIDSMEGRRPSGELL